MQEQSKTLQLNERGTIEKGTTSRVEVVRRLSLNTPPTTAGEPSDLEYEEEKETESNGTVNVDAENFVDTTRNAGGQSKGKEESTDELWTNMFKNNRATNNGMNLTYFPPQIVDGQTMVQLEEDEVQVEEYKWKCALIAYVIGECPGYNTMHRHITMNWTVVTKPDVYLHEEGHYIVKFQNLSDMNEIVYTRPYTINNRPIILKQWSPEFDFGN
ncbi:hypothetical protein KY285_007796 [Solanum tuberosum]|nr:hypothetical protein KY285_007796 [Solanum tuberosum]